MLREDLGVYVAVISHARPNNVDPMTAVVGQFYNNVFHIHDEFYLNNSDTYKMVDE